MDFLAGVERLCRAIWISAALVQSFRRQTLSFLAVFQAARSEVSQL